MDRAAKGGKRTFPGAAMHPQKGSNRRLRPFGTLLYLKPALK